MEQNKETFERGSEMMVEFRDAQDADASKVPHYVVTLMTGRLDFFVAGF